MPITDLVQQLGQLAVFGIPASVIVLLVVEVLKRFKVVSGDWAIPAALATGIVLSVANKLSELVPGFAAWYEVVIAGLMAGFVAAGMYDASATTIARAKALISNWLTPNE